MKLSRGEIVILGFGFAGRRTAALLRSAGRRVAATARSGEGVQRIRAAGCRAIRFEAGVDSPERLAAEVEPGSALLYSLPTLRRASGLWEPAPQILGALEGKIARLVYLSTTGVYGPARMVDAATAINPQSERQRLRAAAERAVAAGPWEGLILRPAAIYGPGRGVQVALPAGKYKLVGDGSRYTSRIHVDDLAAITAAALMSDLTGAYPVADDCPSTSREIAEFTAALLGVALPGSVSEDEVDETRRADRRVDGSEIRLRLGVELRYRSYREGIPASLADAEP